MKKRRREEMAHDTSVIKKVGVVKPTSRIAKISPKDTTFNLFAKVFPLQNLLAIQ